MFRGEKPGHWGQDKSRLSQVERFALYNFYLVFQGFIHFCSISPLPFVIFLRSTIHCFLLLSSFPFLSVLLFRSFASICSSIILISFSSYLLSFLFCFIASSFCSFLVLADLSSLTFCLLVFVYFLSFCFNWKHGEIVFYSFDTFTLRDKGSRMERKSGTP